MKHVRIAFALAVLALAVPALKADQAPYGPVVGRAYSVDTRHFVIGGIPGPDIVTVDQKVAYSSMKSSPSSGFTDILSTCPADLVSTLCTPAAFLGSCPTITTPYTFLIPGATVVGSTTTCTVTTAGLCQEVSGHLISKDQPELESIDPGTGCEF
jgi:hypothetical protein